MSSATVLKISQIFFIVLLPQKVHGPEQSRAMGLKSGEYSGKKIGSKLTQSSFFFLCQVALSHNLP
jgi:hypothetical protein